MLGTGNARIRVALAPRCAAHSRFLFAGQLHNLSGVRSRRLTSRLPPASALRLLPRILQPPLTSSAPSIAIFFNSLIPLHPHSLSDQALTLSLHSGFSFTPSTSKTDVQFPSGPISWQTASTRFSFIPQSGNSAWVVSVIAESQQSDKSVILVQPIGWHTAVARALQMPPPPNSAALSRNR